MHNSACLFKAIATIKPLLHQLLLFGYIAAFHMPGLMVQYLGTTGHSAFLRGALRSAYGKDKSEFNVAECLAATLGPGEEECKTQTAPLPPAPADNYGPSVATRGKSRATAFWHQTAIYRDGVAFDPWSKSLETIADLYSLDMGHLERTSSGGSGGPPHSPLHRRGSSATSALFAEQYRGALCVSTTVLWGQQDVACSQPVCLDGIGDYLARDSEVLLLPRSGHWTPVESESREVLARVVEYFVVDGHDTGGDPVVQLVKAGYHDAALLVKR